MNKYVATLPDGYEWRFMNIGSHGLRVVGCHPEKGVKMYRLDGMTLIEEEIKLADEMNG